MRVHKIAKPHIAKIVHKLGVPHICGLFGEAAAGSGSRGPPPQIVVGDVMRLTEGSLVWSSA